MKYLTTVLILALASANASKYYRPEQQFQQEPRHLPYMAIALDEDQFVPLVEEATRWESPLEPRMMLFNDLDSLENFLQDDSNESRIKRAKLSLSIDDPLDVLRRQFQKAQERRMKNHLIEDRPRSTKVLQFVKETCPGYKFSEEYEPSLCGVQKAMGETENIS